MPKDDRLYAKFTLDFPDHAKIMPLSNEAFRCLVEATLWSRKHMTDGLLPRRYAIAKWSLEVLRELCENDPVKPSLIESEEGWRIHDYAAIQDTRAEIEARRERNRIAGKQGGLAKAKRSAKQVASESLSENVPETETETETETREVTTDVVTSPSVPRKRVTRGTRIDPEFFPTQKTVDGIKAETGATSDQLTFQHRKFIDHWLQQSGQRGVKADWDATWRNWMRTACERGQLGNGATVTQIPRNGSRGPTGTQLAYDNLDRLAAKYATESAYPADDYAEIQGELL